jgi:hypothetical protein
MNARTVASTSDRRSPNLVVHQFESANGVERADRLGGLLHEYRLAA